MIKLGSLSYFIYMFSCLIILILLILFLKNKNNKFQKWFIFILLISGFILHFCKLLIKEYQDDLPYSLKKVTFENICAVSTLIFPFIYLSKNKKWKDYMYVLGILGGFGALVYPAPALNRNALTFEVIRFYYCHFVLLASSVLMVYYKLHILDYKRLWLVPISFFIILALILVNEVLLMAVGLVNGDLALLFDASNRNASFIFGPTDIFAKCEGYLFWVPNFLKTVPFGPHKGEILYWPILWLVLPAYFWISLLSFLLYLPFTPLRKKEK